MSDVRLRALLRCYPASWRARYGDELEHVIVAASEGGRPSPRTALDVVRSGLRERARAARGGPGAGARLVLCAWTAFVVAGLATQKLSEHWQAATPAADRGLPAAAFDVLVVAAAIGSILVLAGIACALPALAALVAKGGGSGLRRPLRRALACTLVAAAAAIGVVVWAHRLSDQQRNGHDLLYSLGVAGLALAVILCLVAWTAAALAAARSITFGPRLLARETWLAAAVAASMLVMSIATAIWWVSVGAGARPAAMPAVLALMAVATTVGVLGSRDAVRALPAERARRS
jgi:hypothetical protein